MAALKTKRNRKSVSKYINSVEHETRREDALALRDLMEQVTGMKAEMWGDSIVGFGRYSYQQKNGQKAEWPLTGFSPRKSATTLYIMPGFSSFDALLSKLGKHKTGGSCLYINRLENVDLNVLRKIVQQSVSLMRKRYDV